MPEPNDPPSASLAPASGAAGMLEASAAGDPLAAVLGSVRLTGALFFAVDATSPWCVDVPRQDAYSGIILKRRQHVLSYHIIVEGEGWAEIPGLAPVRFRAGDIVAFPQGDPYLMCDRPGTPPELGPSETLDFFRDMAAGRLPFVVTEGGGAPPRARFICGFLGCEGRPFNPMLAGLPRLLHLERPAGGAEDMLEKLIALTLEEARAGRAGGGSVGLRLSELLFVELLRRYAGKPGAKPPGWLAGLGDPRIARALAQLHARPEHGWTVAELAREAGLSRSALAERFTALVGHPPAAYLRLWRMQVAAGLLAEGGPPVAEIGRRVGFASEAAFSRGFKRVAGVSPDAWRRGNRTDTASAPGR
jgi:AraC-like DNA-binding protein